jgi:DNA-binding Lrp family transcriptional regulator
MVPEGSERRIDVDMADLREHDREVLEFLSQDPSTQVAFQGLRRRLGIHPEQLSRALHRLAEDDLVEHTDLGYRVSRKAMHVLSPERLQSEDPGITVLQTYLPTDLDLRALVQSLRGAWVGPLRWYGLSEFADGMRLAWTLEDDSIRLETFIRPGQLMVTAKVASPDRLDDAARLGHQLFQHIAREASREPYPGISG